MASGTCESEILLLLCGIEPPIEKELIEEVPVDPVTSAQNYSIDCCIGRRNDRRKDTSASIDGSQAAPGPVSGTLLDALPMAALPPMMAFPGKWQLEQVEGDMDGVAEDMGISWYGRVAGAQMDWGVGKVTHSFAFSGGCVSITSEGPAGTFSQDLTLDGLPNETVDLGVGAPITATAQIEGSFLHVDSDDVKSKRCVLGGGGVRRDILVMQFSTTSSTCCHIFSRCI